MHISPRIDKEGRIRCPECGGLMRPLHWHYPDKQSLFTEMYLCTDCGEYVFDKNKQECMTFPGNIVDLKRDEI